MKYKGQEIPFPPTIELIRSHLILHPTIQVTPQDVIDYWESKGWKTLKGNEVKSLETAIGTCNGVYVDKKRREAKLAKRLKKEKAKLEQRESLILPPNISGKGCKSIKEVSDKLLLKECNKKQRSINTQDTGMKYSDQLTDGRWYAFRKFIFAVRGKKCEICGSENILQVHHPHYVSGRKAWEYTCNEVVVLCSECHHKIHKIK